MEQSEVKTEFEHLKSWCSLFTPMTLQKSEKLVLLLSNMSQDVEPFITANL